MISAPTPLIATHNTQRAQLLAELAEQLELWTREVAAYGWGPELVYPMMALAFRIRFLEKERQAAEAREMDKESEVRR